MPPETGGPPLAVHMSVVAFGATHASTSVVVASPDAVTATPAVFVTPFGPMLPGFASSKPRPMYGDDGWVTSVSRNRPQSSMYVLPTASGGAIDGSRPYWIASNAWTASAHGPLVAVPSHF